MKPSLLYSLLRLIVIAGAVSSCSHDDGYPDLSPPDPPGMLTPEVGLSTAALEFDCNGGTEEIRVTTNVPLSLVPQSASAVTDEEWHFAFEDVEPLPVSAALTDSVLTVSVGANRSSFTRSHTVNIYYGNEVVSFVRVNVSGNPACEPRLTAQSRELLTNIRSGMSATMALVDSMQLSYCGVTVADGRYSEENLQKLWADGFGTVHYVNRLRQVLRQGGYGITENLISVYAAVIYTAFVDVWGELPLYTPDNEDDSSDVSLSVAPVIQLYFSNLLHRAIEECPEECLGALSKDVARMALADIYMQQSKYRFAAELLSEVVHGGRYALTDGGSGVIFGVPTPVYTLADAYLKLAECHISLGGNEQAATYVDAVFEAVEWLRRPAGDDMIDTLDYLRRQLRLPGYMAFCKRHSRLAGRPLLWPVYSCEK